jgi:hypothetical protein
MSFGNTFETDLLGLIFHGDGIALIADNAGSTPLTSLYLSLHTADPGEAGAQNATEADYTGYARQAVSRDASGWTVTGNSVALAADVSFPQATSAGADITHFAVGTDETGAGKIIFRGQVTDVVGGDPASLPVVIGTIPRLTTGLTFQLD